MNSAERKTRMIIVRGRVQGVGFRYSCRDVARELGVKGWVNNQPDGGVQIVANAPEEALDRFLEWLSEGPPSARVDSVETSEGEDLETTSGDFEIR